MNCGKRHVRVLYSFPHRLGAGRICYTAWQQVDGAAAAGADVCVFPGSLERPVRAGVRVRCTLTLGPVRLPYRVIGHKRAFALHDHIVARRVERLADHIDVIHTWPQGSLRTLATAARLGIPTVLERPNAHTRYAFEVVEEECKRLGVSLPPGYEHAFDQDILRTEEEEFRRAYRLLCPSEFVIRTFLERGFARDRLTRHIYGFDEKEYFPAVQRRGDKAGLDVLFVGLSAVRKGLHFALEAWLKSPAHREGKFRIAGGFLPTYQEKLAPMLAHPSVMVLGHRDDIPQLMRDSDILVLPSIEEGFGLVCTEAMGSGCVPLVSNACTDLCRHMENALVHEVGDVATLCDHMTLLHDNHALLTKLRDAGLRLAPRITWEAAGEKLVEVYREVIAAYAESRCTATARSPDSSTA